MALDAYFKKSVRFTFHGRELQFDVSQDLFSSHEVDIGTRLLLRSVFERYDGGFTNVLDLGCGYGPLGLTLKTLYADASVHMVDRDALAVAFSRRNAALNDIDGVEVYGSLGFDDIAERSFDLIASNIPAKAGEPVIARLLTDAASHLRPDGLVAIVVIASIAATVGSVLGGTPGVRVTYEKAHPGYSVFHYQFAAGREPGAPSKAFDDGVYDRERVDVASGGVGFQLETVYGLPEYDAPGHATELLMQGIAEPGGDGVRHALVLHPGQGHAAVLLWRLLRPEQMTLVDRDLLSLRASRRNLILSGVPVERVKILHRAGLDDVVAAPDLIAGRLREDEGADAVGRTAEQAVERLAPGGRMLVTAGSTAVTRVERLLRAHRGVRIVERRRKRGDSLLWIERA